VSVRSVAQVNPYTSTILVQVARARRRLILKMSLEKHTNTDRPAHEVAKSALRTTLLGECIGQANAMSGKDLAKQTPVSSSTVRDLIGELRREEQIPVYSLGNGYFVIASSAEFEECITRIDDEIQTRQETKQELYNAVVKYE